MKKKPYLCANFFVFLDCFNNMTQVIEPIINRVAQSGIVTLDLERYYPDGERVFFDIKAFLFMGLILKEKDFREALKNHDWTQYSGKHVAIGCSTDAIIQLWAYMLLVSYLSPNAATVVCGGLDSLEAVLWQQALAKGVVPEEYQDKRVVVKGCGEKVVPPFAYGEVGRLLQPFVKSLMYGEPCSTVPIYKAK
jgi:hypothetical protein